MDTADRATAAKFAAHHLITQLEEGRDEAGLFAFDSRLREVAPFSVDTRALKGALGEVDPFGATSLHDAISAAAERVATRPMARRAVVVLTDGIDTASRMTPAQVSAKAAAIDVPVYIIAVVLPIDDPGSDRATPGAKRQAPASIGTIEDLARWTGGALYYSSTSASAYQAVARGDRRTAPLVSDCVRARRGAGVAPHRNSDFAEGLRGSDARRLCRWAERLVKVDFVFGDR